MVKLNNSLIVFVSCYLVLLQVSTGWCQSLGQSVVQISRNNRFLCAGTLVRNNVVVTAAHCLQGSTDVTGLNVLAGASIIGSAGVSSAVTTVTIAPGYNPSTRDMNVAILRFTTNAVSPNIQVATLCNQRAPARTQINFYAWTVPAVGTNGPAAQLNTYPGILALNSSCILSYPTVFNEGHMSCGITSVFVQTCFNDRGGPVEINGQFCGILSYGPNCGPLLPHAFVDVGSANVLQFINSQLAP